ncbi:hypothetical protein [Pasteuria penetrans]|nr:hypothetical protein [Pasteuria penetrans]
MIYTTGSSGGASLLIPWLFPLYGIHQERQGVRTRDCGGGRDLLLLY